MFLSLYKGFVSGLAGTFNMSSDHRDSQRFISVDICLEGLNRLRNSDLVIFLCQLKISFHFGKG